MTDRILSSNERLLELVAELDQYAETEGYEHGHPGGLYPGQRKRVRAELEAGIRALDTHETGARLNRLRLERLALQAINSLPCPDAEPLAKALDDQFERITGYRTKNWPHSAETMRLERQDTQET